jgi:prepilin-type N-terminal cleavage/methylation domain-containing protein
VNREDTSGGAGFSLQPGLQPRSGRRLKPPLQAKARSTMAPWEAGFSPREALASLVQRDSSPARTKVRPPKTSTERSRSGREPVQLIRPQDTSQSGFTLLEVLVAAVIMGLAVAGAMSAIASSSRNASRLTQYDRAVTLARQKMDELLVDRNAPRNVPLSGNWDPGIPNAGWNARVTPFEAPPGAGVGNWVLDRVELEIWWMDGQTRRAFTLEGFRRNTIRPGDVINVQ